MKNKEKRKEYYKRHREKILEYAKEWRKRNPEKIREYMRRYYLKHKEKLLEKQRKWYRENKEKVLKYERENYIYYEDYVIQANKRPYPSNGACELCGEKRRLSYHHWDNGNFKLGLWLCPHCHILAEKTEKGITSEKYLRLKAEMEAQELKASELRSKWT